MRRKGLVWKLFPVYFAITLTSVLLVGAVATTSQCEFYEAQVEKDLIVRARLLRDAVKRESLLQESSQEGASTPAGVNTRAEKEIRRLAQTAQVRITLIAPSGRV
ncbi:MAG: hypothetical protein ACPL7K_05270, partial [Armatimonadota bacterium]